MKYLRINGNNGEFLNKESQYKLIDKIDKEDLLFLIDSAVEKEDFEIDPYDSEKIKNPAHQIIYENIYKKFDELLKNKNQLKDQVDNLYKDAFEKYSKSE
ncbi:hypothetical protein [Treponema berlinense]|jgi:hypothetical protein|uniref:hypothetical protein n=1 Tax=Treponema berlinense TaxID=225004 RepID=UPI003F0A0B7E